MLYLNLVGAGLVLVFGIRLALYKRAERRAIDIIKVYSYAGVGNKYYGHYEGDILNELTARVASSYSWPNKWKVVICFWLPLRFWALFPKFETEVKKEMVAQLDYMSNDYFFKQRQGK